MIHQSNIVQRRRGLVIGKRGKGGFITKESYRYRIIVTIKESFKKKSMNQFSE